VRKLERMREVDRDGDLLRFTARGRAVAEQVVATNVERPNLFEGSDN